MIDLKKDINFRYVFGKNEEKNRMALSAMIQAFIGEKVEHLQIQSSELKMDIEWIFWQALVREKKSILRCRCATISMNWHRE